MRSASGWDALVTKDHLDREMAALRHEVLGALERELRGQTWRMAAALLATVTAVTTILRVT